MADEPSETVHELRMRYREFAREPLPDPPLSDEELSAVLHARLRDETPSVHRDATLAGGDLEEPSS